MSNVKEPVDFLDVDPYDPQLIEHHEQQVAKQLEQAPDAAREMIQRRNRAYKAVFSPGKRDQADIDLVLNDLQWFCKVWIPTYDIRDGEHAEELSKRKEGRREVFQRIKEFSRLDGDALMLKYTDAITK